ncbi:unnamed protein product, partial [Symbiodinium sp. KB8]
MRRPWQFFREELIELTTKAGRQQLQDESLHHAQRLFECLPGPAREEFVCMSLQELVAPLKYLESGSGCPWRSWPSLDRESRLQWEPRTLESLHELCCRAPEHWQKELNECGLGDLQEPQSTVSRVPNVHEKYVLQLCVEAFPDRGWVQCLQTSASALPEARKQPQNEHHVPAPLVHASGKIRREPGTGVQSGQPVHGSGKAEQEPGTGVQSSKPVSASGKAKREPGTRVQSGLEVARALFRNLPNAPVEKRMLDYSQVLRLAVGCAQLLHEGAWPRHVAVVNCGDLSSLTLQAEHAAPLICGLLYNDNHWACLAVQRPTSMAVVYDSLPGRKTADIIYDHACAFLTHLAELPEWQSQPRLRPLRASTPQQPDSWSCGHRTVLAIHMAMKCSMQNEPLPTTVDEAWMSGEDIDALIEASRENEQFRVSLHKRPSAAEGAEASAPRAKVRKRAASPPPTPPNPDLPSSQRRGGQMTSPESRASNASTPRALVAKASQGQKRPAHPAPPASDACKPSGKKSRQAKRLRAEAIQQGSEICSLAGLEHKHFQKERAKFDDVDCESGHWHTFLFAVSKASMDEDCREGVLTCHCCRTLQASVLRAQKLAPAAVAPQPDVQGAGAQLVEAEVDGVQQEQAPIQPLQLVQGKQVHKKGRPKKSETAADRWSLHVFIAQERAWLYTQTSASHSASVTYFCKGCDREIKFCSSTCKQKLDKREATATHRKGVQKLRARLEGEGRLPVQRDVEPSESSGQLAAPAPDQVSACAGLCPPGLEAAALKFVEAGQPRSTFAEHEADPFAGCQFLVKECKQREGSCERCRQLCKGRAFRKHLATKAYHIDLVHLAWALFHTNEAKVAALVSEMQQSDYMKAGLAGEDLQKITACTAKLAAVRMIRAKFDCLPAWRISASMRSWLRHNLVQTPLHHKNDTQALAHSALAASLSQAVANGSVRKLDLQLASKVAAGALRMDSLVDSMVTSFLQTLHLSCSRRRKTTSEYINQDAVVAALETLGQGPQVQEMFQRFGMNPRALPKLQIDTKASPSSYISLADPDRLGLCFKTAASHLHSQGSRMHILIDETTWSRDLQQVKGLFGGSGRVASLVGGAWDLENDLDWSDLDAAEWHPQDVPPDCLARTSLHFAVQRADSCRWVFDICHLPRKQAIGNGDLVLNLAAHLLSIVTEHNSGVPPQGCAFDGGSANSRLCMALCGLLPTAAMGDLPFFKFCSLYKPAYKYWPFAEVLYRKSFLLTSNNGSYHVTKRYSLQHSSGCRKVRYGDCWVDLTSLLMNNLPPRAYACTDPMSDRHAIMKLSPPYIGRTWAALPVHIAGLIAGLLCSATSGSPGFTKAEMALNSFSAYHLLLLHRAYNWVLKRSPSETLSGITPVEPCCVTEIGVEQHFGRLKSGFTGQPSLGDCQYGILRCHAKQAQVLAKKSPEELEKEASDRTCQSRQALGHEELQRLCSVSLVTAIQFFCWICIDVSPCDMTTHLLKFWGAEGRNLFPSTAPDMPEDPEDPEDMHPGLEELDLEGKELEMQSQLLQKLQTVHDRALLSEEVQALLQDKEPASTDEPPAADEQPTANEAPLDELIPPEADESPDVPKTLKDIVQKVSRKGDACLDLETATGEKAMLRRLKLLAGPCRQLIRLARLEEGLLSAAVLENGQGDLNPWNLREHLIAKARKVADLSSQRKSRATAWMQATGKLVQGIQKHAGNDANDGVLPLHGLRPYGADPQLLVLKLQDSRGRPTVALGLCMSVHRGAVVKKNDTTASVRASYPSPFPLHPSVTKVIHVSLLTQVTVDTAAPEDRHWATSVASTILMLEPAGNVICEIKAEVRETSTRFYANLGEASRAALAKLRSSRLPDVAELADEEGAELHELPTCEMPSMLEFNERTFSKPRLAEQIRLFFQGLSKQYATLGVPLHENGLVRLNNTEHKYDDLVTRAATFFLATAGTSDLRGFRFSSYVFNKLRVLMPSASNPSLKGVRAFFTNVLQVTGEAVRLPN